MCVFNGVMGDSGTIGFIASQEMARKQGRGAGSLEARGPGGLNNSTAPGVPWLHPRAGHSECAVPVLPVQEGWVGQSDASLAPSQASNGCREFFCGKFGIIPCI